MIAAVGPPRTSLRRLNSSPSENMSRMTPSSDSVLDRLLVGDQRDRDVRPDDQPGQQVAEHHRLPQPLEHDGRDAATPSTMRQVAQEVVGVVHRAGALRREAAVGVRRCGP